MPHPKSINPKTGKRYDFVDPDRQIEQIEKQKAVVLRQAKALEARESLLSYVKFTMPEIGHENDIERSRYDAQPFHAEVCKALEDMVVHDKFRQLIFVMPPRHGKSCAHDTPILTPNGWRQHGDLGPGDFVFGPDGLPTRVLAISADVDEVVPVTLSNGEVIRCHLNHEWRVYDRARGAWRVMETREIAARELRNGPDGSRGGRWTLQLPLAAAVRFKDAVLPVDPYVLGVWLGDGSADRQKIAHHRADTECIDAIEAAGYPVTASYEQKGTGVHYTSFDSLRPLLKAAGLLFDKHIPEAYLRSSVGQRLQLLAGLIDTDGHVEAKTGRVRFSTCSEKLRDGVFDLAAGLGFRPYVVAVSPSTSSSGIVGRQTVYQVGFQPTMDVPTRVPRKAIKRFAKQRRIGIVSVGQVEKAGARSICVEREDGLYLVGRQLVVTKNTELTTKRLSAWVSGLHPDWDIAVASYSDTMAEDMGADTRAILTSAQHKTVFPSYRLRRGGTSKSNIQTDTGGRLVFVGRGGALTGRGMHLGIGDDLFKDHEEARSQTIRDQAWNWFTKVFMTRRMGRKLVILTFTRWHPDDIIGRITDPENPYYNAIEASKWKIIRLPAIAEEDDPIGRQPGEALWPTRYDLDFLQSQQRLDPLGFAALYQQRPTVADGILFRRETLQFYTPDQLPTDLRIYAASDHAVGTKQRNDPSCLGKVGVDRQNNIYILEVDWRRMASDVAVEAMLTMMNGPRKPLYWWAERGHISKSIGPFLRKRMEETGTYINLIEVTPAVDKEQRAQSIAGRVAMGKVFFPKNAWWTEKAINELLAFPNGTHDDFVDMLAYIGLGLESQYGPGTARSQKAAPTHGTFNWMKKQDEWIARQQGQSRSGF